VTKLNYKHKETNNYLSYITKCTPCACSLTEVLLSFWLL
jgi:hypothetical protein